MSAKSIYRKFLSKTENIPQKIVTVKTNIGEIYDINRKKNLYKDIQWTAKQKKDFDDYWVKISGKKIPDKWHKLYQAVSGKYNYKYVPEKLYTTKIEPTLNDYMYERVLANKALVEYMCADSDIVFPRTILVCDNGVLYNHERVIISREEAVRLVLESKEDLVLKKTVGSSSGKDMFFYKAGEGDGGINGMFKELGDNYIAQYKIVQHPVLAQFNPDSVNTLRVITYNTKTKTSHSPVSFRIGRANKFVDNIHAGGLVIGVKEDGTLRKNAYELGYGDKSVAYEKHPDTGIEFEGNEIPRFKDIVNAAERLHGRFLHVGVISWDFTVNSDNEIVLIEVNTWGQGTWFPQMISGEGLFGDDLPEILKMM
jgi:hypothetical protein